METQSCHSSHDRDPVDTKEVPDRETIQKPEYNVGDTAGYGQQTVAEGPLHVSELNQQQETEVARLQAELQRKDEVIQSKNDQIEYLQNSLSEMAERLSKLEGRTLPEQSEHTAEFHPARSRCRKEHLSSVVDERFEREFPSASRRRKLREEINFFGSQLKNSGMSTAAEGAAHGEEDESLLDYLHEYEMHPSAVRGRSSYSGSVFDTARHMSRHMDHWQRKNPMEEYATISPGSKISVAKTRRELDLEEIQRLQKERDRLYEHLRNIDTSRYREVLSKSETFLRNSDASGQHWNDSNVQENMQRPSCVEEASKDARYKSFLDKSSNFQKSVSRLCY
eukprot:gb/GECG01006705.1/.p1 GENE.gb/GECG01006705.1/~~gb/GECG01006705.1/.p1  ORF type:complete len:337 (+),score=50.69 gb/GECG01006705.1/:1-1011(+)